MDIGRFLEGFLLLAPGFLLGITFHELAHGLAADRLGDPTPRAAGRLTLNPLKHLDPIGVIAFLVMKIGWARPVPVNDRFFSHPRRDLFLVAGAGIAANLLLAVASGIIARSLALFHGTLPPAVLYPALKILAASVWINVMLAVFNLLPVPPLDGAKLVASLLPERMARIFSRLDPFGFLILLLLFYAGVIEQIILPLIQAANTLILG